MTLLIDSSEPDNIVRLLRQSVPVTVTNLNKLHMSDYYFSNYEGKTLQFSRKQAGELAGNVDEAEDQLRDYYCLHPITKVLMASLEWKPLSQIQVGDKLVGIDELSLKEQGYHRKLRESVVIDKQSVTKETYIINFEDDQFVMASGEHMWLQVGKEQAYKKYARTDWTRTDDLQPGMKLKYLCKPWEYDTSREAGYLAAALSGEGTIQQHSVIFYQNAGSFLDEFITILHSKGYKFIVGKPKPSGTIPVLTSRLEDRIRLLGSIRPIRFMDKALDSWENKEPQQVTEVRSVVSLGSMELINITTTTHTFIAEGLVTHNCNADRNYQIVEGITSSDKLKIKGATVPIDSHDLPGVSTRDLGSRLFCYKVEPGGYIEKGHSFSAINDSLLYAWIHRLAEAGITTYYTINWIGTARLLSAIYRNEQKPPEEHSTLQRVVRPRIHIKEAEPFLKSLLFLSNAYKLGIGEKKATALAEHFCNMLDLATADLNEIAAVEGIGKKIAEKILKSMGREV